MSGPTGNGERDRGPPQGYLGATWEPETPPGVTLSRGRRKAILRDAQRAWDDGRPGTAWDILRDNGLGDHYALLQTRVNLVKARDRFTAAMSRYTE